MPPVTVVAVAAGLVATAFTFPVAHADDQTDGFLTAMHRAFGNTQDDAALLDLGHAVCEGMDRGLTYNQTRQIVQEANPQAGPEAPGMFVSLASSAFCPVYMQDIPATAPPPASATAPNPASATAPNPASATAPPPASATAPNPASATASPPASATAPNPVSATAPNPASATAPPPASATAPNPASATAPPPASATDADYLDALHKHGIPENGGDEGMIRAAHQICDDLRNGTTIQEVTASSIAANPPMRPEQMSYAIIAARQYYCPRQM